MTTRHIRAIDLPKSCCHLDGKNSYFMSTEILLKSHGYGTLIFTKDSQSESWERTGYANNSTSDFSDAEWFEFVIHAFY